MAKVINHRTNIIELIACSLSLLNCIPAYALSSEATVVEIRHQGKLTTPDTRRLSGQSIS